MAVMLRFLGQASKQTSQHLVPPSVTPRCLAMGGASPRTPKTPAHDSSPFFAGQCSPPAFYQSEHELPPLPPQPVAAALKTPGPLGGFMLPQVDLENDEPSRGGDTQRSAGTAQQDTPCAARLLTPPPAAADSLGRAGEAGAKSGGQGGRAVRTGGELPVLLGRRHQHSAELNAEPKLKLHAPEAVRAREAYLARQSRIAGRRLPPEGDELQGPALEAELAQATRDAFLSRQTTIARRRLLGARA